MVRCPSINRALAPLLALSVLSLALWFLAARPGQAALSLETGSVATTEFELVVIEAPGCIYCHLFRRDVAPAYAASQRARSVPMRFADINDLDNEDLALTGPIDNVPTVLVLKGHSEIGRVPGYIGPENFFHSINRLLSGAG